MLPIIDVSCIFASLTLQVNLTSKCTTYNFNYEEINHLNHRRCLVCRDTGPSSQDVRPALWLEDEGSRSGDDKPMNVFHGKSHGKHAEFHGISADFYVIKHILAFFVSECLCICNIFPNFAVRLKELRPACRPPFPWECPPAGIFYAL